jgi:hypothetical protein
MFERVTHRQSLGASQIPDNEHTANSRRENVTMGLPKPHEDVVSEKVGDELVLVNLRTNEIFALNPTGARFWELLVAGSSREAIEEQLLLEYEVDRDVLVAEIDAMFVELERQKMVRTD